jgi:hypothetical protein
MPASRENRRRQSESLRITTLGLPRCSSDSWNQRPSWGWTFNVSKNPAEIRIAASVSGSPDPVRL